MHLGKKIKKARQAKELTQQQLADKIGKTRSLISIIEQKGTINHYTLRDINKALGVNIEEEDNVLEPEGSYPSKKEEKLIAAAEKLKNDNLLLKELVESQKETIRLLKERLSKSK